MNYNSHEAPARLRAVTNQAGRGERGGQWEKRLAAVGGLNLKGAGAGADVAAWCWRCVAIVPQGSAAAVREPLARLLGGLSPAGGRCPPAAGRVVVLGGRGEHGGDGGGSGGALVSVFFPLRSPGWGS